MNFREIYNSAKCLFNDLILPFYAIQRDMPIPTENRRNENDAEHSWSLALMACSLAPKIEPKLNVGKICQLAIIHDLVELYTGDVSVFEKDDLRHQQKPQKEAAALARIINDFSEFTWLTSTLEEYEQQSSEEAKYVRAVDKLIAPLLRLQDRQYFKENNITREKFNQYIVTPLNKAKASPRAYELAKMAHQELRNKPEIFAKER